MVQGTVVAKFETVREGEVFKQVTVPMTKDEVTQLLQQGDLVKQGIRNTEIANGLRSPNAAVPNQVVLQLYCYW